jgi:hypothetical protein
MRRFAWTARNSWLWVFLSVFMAFLMVITLLPHEALAQNLNTKPASPEAFYEEAPAEVTPPPEPALPVVVTDGQNKKLEQLLMIPGQQAHRLIEMDKPALFFGEMAVTM